MDEWHQCLPAERVGTHILRREEGQERMGMVVDMAEVAVVDLEAQEVVMVVVAADPWALLPHLETGDVVRGPMLMVVAVEASSEVEEVVTSGLLHVPDTMDVLALHHGMLWRALAASIMKRDKVQLVNRMISTQSPKCHSLSATVEIRLTDMD